MLGAPLAGRSEPAELTRWLEERGFRIDDDMNAVYSVCGRNRRVYSKIWSIEETFVGGQNEWNKIENIDYSMIQNEKNLRQKQSKLPFIDTWAQEGEHFLKKVHEIES
jgi:hypothetical protein